MLALGEELLFFIYVIYIYSYIHCIFMQSFLSRYKWNRFGRYVYLVMLLLYVLFLLALTVYTVSAPAPYSPSQIIELAKKGLNVTQSQIESTLDGYKEEGYGTEQSCRDVQKLTQLEKGNLQRMGQLGVFIMAALHIVKEMFQMIQGCNSIDIWKLRLELGP